MKTKRRGKPTSKLALAETNGHAISIVPPAIPMYLRLDLGCGSNKREGFTGVDSIAFPGVDVVADLTKKWPWPDSSVAEAHSAHFLEHLTNFEGRWERVHFFNELWRVLIRGGKAQIIIPHWCSNRYFGDPTHKEAFSEMGWFYLLREWRLGNPEKNIAANAPHTDIKYNPNGYSCDFDATWGYTLSQQLMLRNEEYRNFAMGNYKEACQDQVATLVARKG